jgi:cobyrinic acid a,c-diamide synthase
MPRIVIAATQSGTGKTSVALALVASLQRRGLRVQTFKVGPDFLDPSYLSLASGRPCYNLDGWMTGKEYVSGLFDRAARDADVAVIEGVMGLFDGADPAHPEGSTAEIASWLDAPVLLVVNVHGMARSLAPLVKGFVEFEPDLKIAGIIANHSGSNRHASWLSRSLESSSLPPLLGAVPRGALPTLPSRHLGLVTADSRNLSRELLQQMADFFERQMPLDRILQTARSARPLFSSYSAPETDFPERRTVIGLAYDRAFHFYYPDNLEALTSRGCEIVRFSPLEDKNLPDGLEGLYIGGGYPEEYAEVLSENRAMLESIRHFAATGLPIYAECGGLMYLTRGIEARNGKRYSMAGILPAWSRMLPHLKSLGYVEVTLSENSLWGGPGAVLRGHEFHYSELAEGNWSESPWTPVYRLKCRQSEAIRFEGFQRGKMLASYVHLHWAAQPTAVQTLINSYGARS